jgi:hypothetical protein
MKARRHLVKKSKENPRIRIADMKIGLSQAFFEFLQTDCPAAIVVHNAKFTAQ